ncbi:MAG: hypothetical protein ACPH5P_08040 [Akkermansiaceae bacterium]
MTLRTFFWLCVITGLLMAPLARAQSALTHDGYEPAVPTYTDSVAFHICNSDNTNTSAAVHSATIKNTLLSLTDITRAAVHGDRSFLLHIEQPKSLQRVTWANALSAQDISRYKMHYNKKTMEEVATDYGQISLLDSKR